MKDHLPEDHKSGTKCTQVLLPLTIILLTESYDVLEGEEDDDERVDPVERDGDDGRPVRLAALRLHRLELLHRRDDERQRRQDHHPQREEGHKLEQRGHILDFTYTELRVSELFKSAP